MPKAELHPFLAERKILCVENHRVNHREGIKIECTDGATATILPASDGTLLLITTHDPNVSGFADLVLDNQYEIHQSIVNYIHNKARTWAEGTLLRFVGFDETNSSRTVAAFRTKEGKFLIILEEDQVRLLKNPKKED